MEIDRHFGAAELVTDTSITRQAQLEHDKNFLNKEGLLTLVHCVSCDKENHAMAAAFGRCAWCCWSDQERNHCERCMAPNTKQEFERSVLVKNLWTHYFLCDPCGEEFADTHKKLKLDPESYEAGVQKFMEELPSEVVN